VTVEVGNYLNVGEFQRSPQRTGHDDRATPSDEPLEALDNTNTVLGLVYSPSTDVSSGTVPMSLYTRVIPADSPLTLVYPGFAFASLSLASEEPYPSYAG
jgi:hypothetical protein